MNRTIFVSGMALVLTLAACGSGGSGDGPATGPSAFPPPPTSGASLDCNTTDAVKTSAVDALPGGLWSGSLINCVTTARSDYAQAWVTEDGRFRIFGPDRLLLRGQLDSDGDTFSGDGREFAFSGPVDQSGTSLVTSGSIAERASLDGRWSTDAGFNGVFALHYDPGYHLLPSSFDELPGARSTWDLNTNVLGIWTIEPDGRFNGQDEVGCAQSGHFALVDARYNLYELEYTIVGCVEAGSYSGLATVGRDGLSGDRLLDISVDDGNQRALRIIIYF